jgi:hypothetical protein
MTGAICWYASASSVCVDSTTDGVLKFYGSGGTNNEDLAWDYETTSNEVAVSSSTGVTLVDWGTLDHTTSGTVTVGTLTDGTLTITGGDISSAGTVTATSLTDGTATLTGGALSGGSSVSATTITDGTATLTSDTLTAGTITDGTATLTGGDLSGAGTVTATTLTDGTMSSTAGAITGATTIDATVDIEVSAATGGLIKVTDDTTPGDAAGTGALEFHAEDDASNDHVMAKIAMDVTSAATGAEVADAILYGTVGGALTEILRANGSSGGITMGGTSATLKADSTDDSIIIQETDTPGDAICIRTAGSTARVYAGDCSSFTTLYSNSSLVYDDFISQSYAGGTLTLYDSNPTGDTNGTGNINFAAEDSGSGYHVMANIKLDVTDATAGAEYAEGELYATTNGTDATLYLTWGNNAVTLSKPLVHDTQVAASPAAPRTCDATALGTVQVVNDSDDGAGTEVCYCGMTDDSTYDWLDMSDNTACSHY